MNQSRKFILNSVIYALGDMLTKSARVILLPYYISVLTLGEYGVLAILLAIQVACFSLLSLGLGFSIKRFYFDYESKGNVYSSTVWWGRMLLALPLFAILLVGAWVFDQSSSSPITFELLALAICAGFFKGGLNLVESWFVIREEPVKYRAFTFLQFLTSTLLIIYFVSFQEMGVKGALLGEVISQVLWAVVSAVIMTRAAIPKFSQINWKESLQYCLPGVPHVFFMWGLTAADRVILSYYVPYDEIGVYDVGYLLATFMSIAIMAMRSAWLPGYFRDAQSEAGKKKFSSTAIMYFFVIFFAALGGALFAPEGVAIMARNSAAGAVAIFRVVVIGLAFFAVFVAFNQPLFYERRVAIISLISGFGLITNIIANVLLIPKFGIMGAAISTIMAYVVIAILVLTVVHREYPIHWNYGFVSWLGLVALGLGIVGSILSTQGDLVSILLRIVILAAYPLLTLLKVDRDDSNRLRVGFRIGPRGLLARGKSPDPASAT